MQWTILYKKWTILQYKTLTISAAKAFGESHQDNGLFRQIKK